MAKGAAALGTYEDLVAAIPGAVEAIVRSEDGATIRFSSLYKSARKARAALVAMGYEGEEARELYGGYCHLLSQAIAVERERRGYQQPPSDPDSYVQKRQRCRICQGRGEVPYKIEDRSSTLYGATYYAVCSCVAAYIYGEEALDPGGDLAVGARLERAGLPDKALRERWTLDSFGALLARYGDIEGAGERQLALDVAREYAKDPRGFPAAFGGRGSLLFTGDWGTGKTSLVCGILRDVTRKDPGASIRFMAWSALLGRLKDAYASGTGADRFLMGELRGIQYLALDDIGDAERTTASSWERSTAEDVLLDRYNRGARTLLTSNLTRQQLEQQIGGRLVDRIYGDWAVVLDMPGASLRRGEEW